MLLAGASSVLALDAPKDSEGWPVTLRHPLDRQNVVLRTAISGVAVSGSGLEQGRHIIDPRPGRGCPVEGKLAAWSVAPNATAADALSTAFMVMAANDIEALCRTRPDTGGVTILAQSASNDGAEVQRFGRWREEGFGVE